MLNVGQKLSVYFTNFQYFLRVGLMMCSSSSDSGVILDFYFWCFNRGPKEKLDSSMLKSKNQVTLYVNYSYNSFYDLHSSKHI